MFDFHMHSKVSFDGRGSAADMARAAADRGLQAICFTDHLDYDPRHPEKKLAFHTEDYRAAYDHLEIPGLEIFHGIEFGLLPGNQNVLQQDLKRYPFDFVIGSIHYINGYDPYFPELWEYMTPEAAELRYFEEMLESISVHDDFDVLGHITYISKCRCNPRKEPIPLKRHQELMDAIFEKLVSKGKGIEINTSGVDACGAFLPDESYLRRFRELGGEIVTVGSDAHDPNRVGQYCREACKLVQSVLGYVCTFRERKPVFHKI